MSEETLMLKDGAHDYTGVRAQIHLFQRKVERLEDDIREAIQVDGLAGEPAAMKYMQKIEAISNESGKKLTSLTKNFTGEETHFKRCITETAALIDASITRLQRESRVFAADLVDKLGQPKVIGLEITPVLIKTQSNMAGDGLFDTIKSIEESMKASKAKREERLQDLYERPSYSKFVTIMRVNPETLSSLASTLNKETERLLPVLVTPEDVRDIQAGQQDGPAFKKAVRRQVDNAHARCITGIIDHAAVNKFVQNTAFTTFMNVTVPKVVEDTLTRKKGCADVIEEYFEAKWDELTA